MLYSKWRFTIIAVEQFIFVVKSTYMCVEASLLSKCTATKLTLVWLHFSMNHYDVGFEIFSYNTVITLFILFLLVFKHLSLLTKLFKTQLKKYLPVEINAFLFKWLCLFVGHSKNISKNRRRAYYGAGGGGGILHNSKIKHELLWLFN